MNRRVPTQCSRPFDEENDRGFAKLPLDPIENLLTRHYDRRIIVIDDPLGVGEIVSYGCER